MMENSDNEEKSPISKEILEIGLKNSVNVVKYNQVDSITLSASPSIKVEKAEKLDEYCSVELIKKEYNDSDYVFIENRASNCPVIKIEPGEHFLKNANNDVKCILDPTVVDLDKFNNLSTYEDWKLKNEEIDIKEEKLEQTEIRMSANLIGQEKHKDYIIENGHQEMQKQNLKKPENLNMFKCDQCDFQTLWKKNLKVHFLRHKNPEDIIMFKCEQCNYQALRKSNLKMHLLKHKNPGDVDMIKCDQCDYQTIWKHDLKRHLFRHKNPKDVDLFKCDQCDYQSLYKDPFTRHLLKHKNPEYVDKFKCDHCDYKTLQKRNLKSHLLRHKNPEDVNWFKCDQCDYQTVYKHRLKVHLLRHKN